jgi:L-fuculose-phosphate aldolase
VTADDRRAVVAAVRKLAASGLNVGTAGNVGLRVDGGLLVTPSGVPPDELVEADIVALDADGAPGSGQPVPTSEWRLHVAVLKARPDVVAVVHTHSPEATAAACVGRPLPAVHYVVARTGGSSVPVAPYATYGSAELAANVVGALGDGMACLIANHGLLTVGPTLDAAVALAADLEWLAGVWRRASMLGDPVVLPDDEIARVAEQFRTYGQPPPERRPPEP